MAVRKPSSLWVGECLPLASLSQGVRPEDKPLSGALRGTQPVYKASQNAGEGGLSVLSVIPVSPHLQRLLTLTEGM